MPLTNDFKRVFYILLNCAFVIYLSVAQCPTGTTLSFEKIANVNVRGANLVPLYEASRGLPVSAECNNRCRSGPNCKGFLLNYEKHLCMAMNYDADNRASTIISASDSTSFFEKICLSVASCEKAWTFERVIGKKLEGFDDKVLTDVPSRLKCQEICLLEEQFICRSGEYDYVTQECRLSSEDRRTQANHFVSAPSSIDYFENQCSPLSLVKEDDGTTHSADCGYKRHDNYDLGRPDLMRSAYSEEQCRTLCDATRAFVCRSYSYKASSSLCWLSSDDTHVYSAGSESLIPSPGITYFERSDCLNIKLDCYPDEMKLSLNTIEPFEGKIYSKENPLNCESLGGSQRSVSLSFPLNFAKCGVRKEIDGRYSTTVIVQNHPVIQRKGDRILRLVCNFEAPIKLVSNSFRILPPDTLGSAVVNATASSPNIKLRITDQDGRDIRGARLGEELYLRIDMEDETGFDLFARDLVARSGNNDEAITLIDSNGCPTDTAIFPSLEKVPNSKSLQGKFDAFKFADDEVVRFQVNVHFCLHQCSPAACNSAIPNLTEDSSSPSTTVSPLLNDTLPDKNFPRKKREAKNLTNSATTLLPDYPLQKEIIVEGLSSKNSETETSENLSRKVLDPSVMCTSKITLLAAFIATLVFQTSLIAFCCSCFFFWKIRPSNKKHIHQEKLASYYARRAYPGSWSLSSVAE